MQYIILDIDGTLLTSNHQLPIKTQQYLIELQKRGKIIILASGRTQRRMQPIIDLLQIDGYCISGNGYKIFHTKNQDEIVLASFNDQQIQYFFNLLKKYELEIFTFTDNILNYYLPKHLEQEKLDYIQKHHLPSNTQLVGGPYATVFNHSGAYDEINRKDNLNESAYKLCVRGPFETLQIIQKALQNEKCQSVITSKNWLEILPLENSKGNAIKKLFTKQNYDLNSTIAFGDGENDLQMLRVVKKGYAMGNAVESLKQNIKNVVATNDEEGVYQTLFEHFK